MKFYTRTSWNTFKRLPYLTEEDLRVKLIESRANSRNTFAIIDSISTRKYYTNITYKQVEDLYELSYTENYGKIVPYIVKKPNLIDRFFSNPMVYKMQEIEVDWFTIQNTEYVSKVTILPLDLPEYFIEG